jgi:hypothetical protein
MRARRAGTLAAAVLAAFAIAIGGCGDDEEPASSTSTTEQAEDTSTTDRTPTTEKTDKTEMEKGDDSPSGGMKAPPADGGESGAGGAGDEVPASSQALITGRDGSFHPTVVHVPPFIAIRVELISEDGVEYELEGPGGKKVEAGGEIRSASTMFPGLRAGERLVLRGDQSRVTIEANAEPGP